tara:strand:+ start:417 stop:944 length:528 start_codon:yes stop_codon:yes gene_type:complete
MSIKISDMIDDLTVEVNQDFIDYRNNQTKYGNYSSWNNFKNSDHLLLEHTLIQSKSIEPPIKYENESKAWRYDGSYINNKLDFKHLKEQKGTGNFFFNVQTEKKKWGKSMKDQLDESISIGFLDYFVFYTSRPMLERNYVVGDRISFDFLKVLKAKDVMESLIYNKKNKNYFKII